MSLFRTLLEKINWKYVSESLSKDCYDTITLNKEQKHKLKLIKS